MCRVRAALGQDHHGREPDNPGRARGPPCRVVRTHHQVQGHVWRDMLYTLESVITNVDKQEGRIELVTGGVIDFWTLHDNPNAGRGRKYKRVVIDEAAIVRGLQDAWTGAIRPTLTDLKGDAWFLSTPKGHNYFHKLWLRGQGDDPDWKSWRMGTVENPHISDSEVAAARRDMPEAVFEQEYLGIPADDAGNPFGLSHIAACIGELSPDPPVAFGVDLAKSVDWTVVLGLDAQGRVCVFERWQRVPWGETTERVLDIVGSVGTLADSTGVGDPIVEELARTSPNIEGFKFTSESKQRIMEGLSAAIQGETIQYPAGDISAELETFEYVMRPGGGVRYSAPEGMHDDTVIAKALAWKAAQMGEAEFRWA